ncbi:right-handed parallel beta-helix repeat-containing protein [Streptomyces ochraceiscleroticus]|uniref:Right-handed parallel beta-helix repeat-containing protein n=1 Tax=Streptomyces ochraceiscleroticus TaxID=47761 RepID=A0ABW1MKE9_9ACTN|nr:right-handed parallel beta-helix repeat-containing protein [Streptomyces ochraceiscleroticus]
MTDRSSGVIRTLRAGIVLLSAGTLVTGLTGVLAPPAQAAACSGQVRYASSTNTLYLMSGTSSPSGISTLCPSAPLHQVDGSPGTWQLDANLVIQNGATLELHGSAAGGEVDTLRLSSPAGGGPTEVASITAQYGTIDIDRVDITSWDEQANGPDTDPSAASGERGRAFIRALSYLDTDGTPRESTMNIYHSDIGYLGYYAAESYGVAYKARGCDITHQDVCDKLDVFGDQIGSRFHHNYMGTYTFGAYGMTFDRNEYDHNVAYGLDPHDDSDYLTITNNHAHDNGNHGIICSQRCDHLEIVGNESDHNGIPPYLPPGDDDASDNQVHGIMLHRGVTDSVVRDNNVHDQPNGAGIAVFDSSDDVIENNTVTRAKFGLRYSVGSQDITSANNTVTDSGQYAVYTYQGSDKPVYTNDTGRPARLAFTGNTFDGSGSNVLKIGQSDDLTFSGNTFTGTLASGALTQQTTGTYFDRNTAPSRLTYSVKGDSGTPGSIAFRDQNPVNVQLDSASSAAFTATGLKPGASYKLTADGRTVATGKADSMGTVTLRAKQASTSAVSYRIAAA